MTLSIIARDPATDALGVATMSFLTGVGTRVAYVDPSVGIVVTQMLYHPVHAPRAFAALLADASASAAIDAALADDPAPQVRQLAVMGTRGGPAAYTGASVVRYAEQFIGGDVVAVGAMLASPGIPEAMVRTFQMSTRPFAWRFIDALDAAERAGGDLRGARSAALMVLDESEVTGRRIDVRVDHDDAPLRALTRALRGHDLNADIETAFALVAGGQLSAADRALARLASTDPDDPDRAFRHAITLALAGNLESARRELDRMKSNRARWR